MCTVLCCPHPAIYQSFPRHGVSSPLLFNKLLIIGITHNKPTTHRTHRTHPATRQASLNFKYHTVTRTLEGLTQFMSFFTARTDHPTIFSPFLMVSSSLRKSIPCTSASSCFRRSRSRACSRRIESSSLCAEPRQN